MVKLDVYVEPIKVTDKNLSPKQLRLLKEIDFKINLSKVTCYKVTLRKPRVINPQLQYLADLVKDKAPNQVGILLEFNDGDIIFYDTSKRLNSRTPDEEIIIKSRYSCHILNGTNKNVKNMMEGKSGYLYRTPNGGVVDFSDPNK